MEFEHFIKKELSLQLLKNFSIANGKVHSKTREELISAIQNDSMLSSESIENLIQEAVKYGSRRMFYISKLSQSDSLKLSSTKNINIGLKKLYFNKQDPFDFDILNTKNSNEQVENTEPKLEYLKRHFVSEKKVNKLEICYSKTLKTAHTKDDQNNVSYTYEKIYIWIEINISSGIICFHIPSTKEAFGTSHQSNSLYNEFAEKIRTAFEINYINVSEYSETLYEMFKDIIAVSEEPFKQRLVPHNELLEQITSLVKEKQLFVKTSSCLDFKDRLKDLIERIIIQENFIEYMKYADDKDGIISQMQFTDQTGGSVNASAGSKIKDSGKIELCDVFFDTRKTIHKNEKVDILWIEWFTHEASSPKHDTITTKFSIAQKYYMINFQRILLTREVEEYVFSKLRKYEAFNWY